MAVDRHIGIGVESTWGTPVAATKFFRLLREDIQLEKEFIRIKTVESKSNLAVRESFGAVRGSLEFVVGYQDIHLLYYLFFGNTTRTGAGPYTWTSPGTSGLTTRVPITVEVKRDSVTDTFRYAGCVITSMALSQPGDDVCRVTVGIMGASVADGTAATASYVTDSATDLVVPSEVSVLVDAAAYTAQDLSINMNWPVDEPRKLGSTTFALQPQDSDVFSIEGSVGGIWTDQTVYDKYISQATVDIQVAAAIDGAPPEAMTINFDAAKIIQATPHITGRERLPGPFTFEAFSTGVTATDPIQTVVVNDQVGTSTSNPF